jgi:hypothetical protein
MAREHVNTNYEMRDQFDENWEFLPRIPKHCLSSWPCDSLLT